METACEEKSHTERLETACEERSHTERLQTACEESSHTERLETAFEAYRETGDMRRKRSHIGTGDNLQTMQRDWRQYVKKAET